MSDPQTDRRSDQAFGGYFEVTDRRPTRGLDREDFHVRSYNKHGELLLHTWNTGEHSMHMEVSALLSRGSYPRGATAEAAAAIVREQNARLEQKLDEVRRAL